MTLILEVDQHFPQPGIVEHAIEHLKDTHGLIVYPTDTVYGVGCDIHDVVAFKKLEKIKGVRGKNSNGKNYSILVKDFAQLKKYTIITPSQEKILKEYLPGPFTFILKASPHVPKYLVSQKGTLGVRIPRNRLCKALIKELKNPLITTSFNFTGEPVVTNPAKAPKKLIASVDVLLDADELGATSSTVVDLAQKKPIILRQGVGVFK